MSVPDDFCNLPTFYWIEIFVSKSIVSKRSKNSVILTQAGAGLSGVQI